MWSPPPLLCQTHLLILLSYQHKFYEIFFAIHLLFHWGWITKWSSIFNITSCNTLMETLFWSPIEGYQYKGLVRAHVCSNFVKMGLAGFRYWIAICSWSNVQLISPKSRFIFNVQYSISCKIYQGDCYIEMAYLLCWIRAQTIVKLQFEEQTEVRPHLNWPQKLIIVIIVLEFQVGLDMVLVLITTILETTMVLVLLRFKEKILGNLSLLTDLWLRW